MKGVMSMQKIKINSMGFGYDKNIRLSEGLITAGTVMIIAGLVIIKTKTQWWTAGDQKTLDTVCKLYESQTS